ncbi:MAG: response regulator [Deltaproteobacteria bacterium]|nr:response regulator [Deltaproteobacteria bacterium]
MEKETILIVEDDERFRKMLSFLFIAKGFNVKTACDGMDAWDYLAENRPSLIILDLVMPGMDGFSLYKRIKEQDRLNMMPVIILTGLSMQEIIGKFESVDLKRYLRKPFRTADIMTMTADVLNNQGEKRSLQRLHPGQGT